MSRVRTEDLVEYKGKTYYAKANGSSVLLYNRKEDIGDPRKQIHAPATTSVRVMSAPAPPSSTSPGPRRPGPSRSIPPSAPPSPPKPAAAGKNPVSASSSEEDDDETPPPPMKTKAKPKAKAKAKEKAAASPSKKIPATVKACLWSKYFEDAGKAKCYVCKTRDIFRDGFEAAHVQSRYNGGSDRLDNLRPCCALCNQSIGTKDLEEFIREYGL